MFHYIQKVTVGNETRYRIRGFRTLHKTKASAREQLKGLRNANKSWRTFFTRRSKS